MKKLTPLVLAAAFGALMFTSCKKDYTCVCKNNDGTESESFQYPKMKKKDAKSACDTWNSLAVIGGGSCSLK